MVAASSAVRTVIDLVAQLAGLVVLAGTLAALAAFLYRWYVREEVPRGLSLLVGLAGVAVYLNTSRALGQVISGSTLPTETEVALFNIAAFAVATGGAVLGRRAGDRFGTDVALGGDIDGVETDVGRLVQSVGRVTAVTLPEEIDDIVGYDPVPEETKGKLGGKTFLFPRRLTVEELTDRLVARLKSDYAVGHVDIELADDGAVEYLALGSRAAGIGSTLPPATNAVALRADPAFAASAGDLVQVWETDPMKRILTAELRGVAEDTVTVAIDAADTPTVNPRKEYRLVTLPVDDRPDREFASLLRAADETFSSVTVEAGSPLHGLPVGALDLTVVAIKSGDEQPVALPGRTHVLAPGEEVFAIARPDSLRRLARAAAPLDPSLGGTQRPEPEPDEATESTPTAGEDGAGGVNGRADASSFQQLKEEFESGESEWGDDEEATEESGDDLSALDVGEPEGGLDLDDDIGFEEDDESEDGDDDGSAGGGTSFEELKEEFESGEADWEDDISDSPGGDMRLDE
ncbi:MAG: TrkA C-terminal domain-containing protein [Haloarculaceae archaeon]